MDPKKVASLYYEAFRQKTDFTEVPMGESMVFRGPTGVIEGADGFRAVLAGLAQGVVGLDIRHQAVDGETVLSVYDFDMGRPDGPIPMAEALRVVDGRIEAVELLFDSPRLG